MTRPDADPSRAASAAPPADPAAADRHAWSRPGAEPVASGVVRVPLPLPSDALRAVNVYVLPSPGGLTLVDGGWSLSASRDALRDALRGLGADLADITGFLVTHMHRDHYTQAVALRRETGARVALGAGERASLERTTDPAGPRPLAAQLDGLRAAGAPDLADVIAGQIDAADDPDERAATRADFAAPDMWLHDGDRLVVGDRTLTAVETPGHTRGHLVYADDGPEPLLFAGDHVLPHITPSIGFEPAATPGALQRFLSLPRPGPHDGRPDAAARARAGRPERARPRRRAPRPPRRTPRRRGGARHRGRPDRRRVAGRLTWTRRDTPLAELEPFHRMLAVLETDAHLEVLAAQGRVVRDPLDGVLHHRAV